MKLNITYPETVRIPDADGTFTSSGSRGGTELMLEGLKQRIDPDLLNKFTIICSRSRNHPAITDRHNIFWLHDCWNDPAVSALADPEFRQAFKKLIFVSHYQQQTYNTGLGVPYSEGEVLQNAIVPIPAHEKPDPAQSLNLIYHTTPHRGLEILVPVFIKLAAVMPNIHLDVFSSFAIYGWNERDVPYEPLFEICRHHPGITYHGFKPNDIIRDALKKAHIFAYPSIWPETSCIAAIEAMSAGCEVVCPNYAALPETTANFAAMYQYDEDPNRHAQKFAEVLYFILTEYTAGRIPNKQHMQKKYFDGVYNWDQRAQQWTVLLESLL